MKKRLKLKIGFARSPALEIDDEFRVITTASLCSLLYFLKSGHIWTKKIRKSILENEGKRCWICGRKSKKLQAHEFWVYSIRKKYLIKN